jgi:hypothetical protein
MPGIRSVRSESAACRGWADTAIPLQSKVKVRQDSQLSEIGLLDVGLRIDIPFPIFEYWALEPGCETDEEGRHCKECVLEIRGLKVREAIMLDGVVGPIPGCAACGSAVTAG